jgi:hypothetical protein
MLFAPLAAIALAEAQRTGLLHTALANRDVIGQAKGISAGSSGGVNRAVRGNCGRRFPFG